MPKIKYRTFLDYIEDHPTVLGRSLQIRGLVREFSNEAPRTDDIAEWTAFVNEKWSTKPIPPDEFWDWFSASSMVERVREMHFWWWTTLPARRRKTVRTLSWA